MHHYRLFGLTLASSIALPELPAAPEGATAEVRIALGEVLDPPGAERMLGLRAAAGIGFLEAPGVRYRVENGSRITVDAEAGTPAQNIRLFLLGSAMAALLHQRGTLPLHANAIETDRGAILFSGKSGAGKSTLAAAFLDRGHRLLADDVSAITRTPRGHQVQPGVPRIRLWRDAVERSGRDTGDLDAAFEGMDKYVVPVGAGRSPEALPLRAIFVLADAGEAGISLRRLPAGEAIQALVANTYRGVYVPLVGDSERHFGSCVAIAREVPVFELRRPWDPAGIEAIVDHVLGRLDAIEG
ncbi:hypothetical protein [Sphingomonas sp.]|uniref:hypothetical protein n=1 Tax=Sphingomonas sp. TaxID=28214 RepID=UPI001B04B6DC|nr:hypothetical protein [Sphingomonas sp.]MBO9712258.1 hypothetical protein [Sphingomonas sp.]